MLRSGNRAGSAEELDVGQRILLTQIKSVEHAFERRAMASSKNHD
jgi:hypothetical protein